jgi:hypothetical protein
MGKRHPKSSASADREPTDIATNGGATPMSFIVRISRQEPGAAEFRGWVEEADSGEKTSFLGFDELRDVLSRYLGG